MKKIVTVMLNYNYFFKVRSIILLLFLLLNTSVFSQEIEITGGFNISRMQEKYKGVIYTDDPKLLPGLLLGANVGFPVSKFFSVETGLIYSTRGLKCIEDPIPSLKQYFWRMNLAYLDIPVLACFSFPLKKTSVYLNAGPYTGIGLSGNIVQTLDIDNEPKEKQKVAWGNKDDEINRIDFGLKFGAGVKVNACKVGLSYGLGLANLASSHLDDIGYFHRFLNLSVAYRIKAF